METVFHQGIDIGLRRLSAAAHLRIATLGPSGTSSEATAQSLATTLALRGWETVRVDLHDTYEDAANDVLKGAASLLLVANAYAEVSEFYMNPRFHLVAAFVRDTPMYGLATREKTPHDGPLSIASHPAPVPLIEELLPEGLEVGQILTMASTSAAAGAAAAGYADVALTTLPAATRHGLEFVSRTRSIRMLWSVFTTEENMSGPHGRAMSRLSEVAG